MDFDIRIRTVKRALILAIGTLILFHLLGQFSAHILGRGRLLGFVEMFRMQSERNVPTFFSGVLLAWAGCLLVFIGWATAKAGARYRWHWVVLGLMFWYLSLDEITSLHEHYSLGNRLPIFSGLVYKWVITGTLLVLIVVAGFFRFWWQLEPRARLGFAVSAAVFVVGAIGFETLSGFYAKSYGEDFGFSVLIVFEEGMEMIGVAIFIVVLLGVIRDRVGPCRVRVVGGEVPPAPTADAEISR